MKALQSSTCCLACTQALVMGNGRQSLTSGCSVLKRPPTASLTTTPTLSWHLIMMEVTSFSRSAVSVKRRQSSRCCRCSRKQQYLVVSESDIFPRFHHEPKNPPHHRPNTFSSTKKASDWLLSTCGGLSKFFKYHPAPIKLFCRFRLHKGQSRSDHFSHPVSMPRPVSQPQDLSLRLLLFAVPLGPSQSLYHSPGR